MIQIAEIINDRPVWKNNDETMFIYSWVFEDGRRSWRIGRDFKEAIAFMQNRDSSNWGCPYQTDGSRFVKLFFFQY